MKEIDKHKSNDYVSVPLYYYYDGRYILYKKAGLMIPQSKIMTHEVPDKLYVMDEDIKTNADELFNKLTEKLQDEIDTGKAPETIVELVEDIVEDMFDNIEADSMSFAPTIIKKIIRSYIHEPNIFKEFIKYVKSEDELVYHSSRVLFYTLNYCYYKRMTLDEIRKYGLAGLFHAIGKTKLNKQLLVNKQLSDDEFEAYKMYPQYSYDILIESENTEIRGISYIALLHKENINRTGFPYKIQITDHLLEAVGIIESFEQLTSPRRKGLGVYSALEIIRKEVEQGKYDKEVYKDFVMCLGLNS